MRKDAAVFTFVAAVAVACGVSLRAAEDQSAQAGETKAAAAGAEVTLVGNLYANAHTGEKEPRVYFMALDGTPAIKAEFDAIIEKYYPDQGLDGDAARALADQFDARLRYNIDGPLFDALRKAVAWTARDLFTLTGVVSFKDGSKWLTVSKFEPKGKFAFPARMLAPDKPFAMPGKKPIILTISNDLSLACIYVPPGKFLQGEPYYMVRSWREDPPHMVTLTKGYYLAEIPITWELYQAVTGNDLRKAGEDPQSAANLSCANVYRFCEILSKNTGRKIRPPTTAELLNAYRVGTSNPPFREKFAGKGIVADGTAPVKASPPNAWGFYEWMCDYGFERTSDAPTTEHRDATDPKYTPREDAANPLQEHKCSHGGFGLSAFEICEFEYIGGGAAPGGKKGYAPNVRERIVVEEDAGTGTANK